MPTLSLLGLLDVMGTFAFGLSGAMVAIRRKLDLFGIACSGGGHRGRWWYHT